MKAILKNIVGAVAPTLGSAMGGPLGNMAMGKIAQVLGVSNDQKSIQQAMQNATPEQMLELKKAEQEFDDTNDGNLSIGWRLGATRIDIKTDGKR